MSEVFLKIVNMSISAGWLVLAVLILRLLLKRAPQWVNVLLWGIVAVRLMFPISIESALSLIPSAETIPLNIAMDTTPTIQTGVEAVNRVVNPLISQSNTPMDGDSVNPLQITIAVWANIWVLGMLGMVLYTAVSYISLRRKLRTAVILEGNIFQCETVRSPFVLGILNPRIYLPYSLDGEKLSYVIAHEQAHIHRNDHLWKPLGFLLLTVYWFNPLMWIAYILLCRDIELACDEKVIGVLDSEQRADYTQALVACSVDRRMIAACPLAFGEVGVKERVKSILNYRKPAFWIVLAAVIVCITVAVCFLTNPLDSVDYLKFTGWSDNPATPDRMCYEVNLGNRAMSGEIYVEAWTNGTCVRSAPVVMTQFVDSIYVTLRERWEGVKPVGMEIAIVTNQYGGSLTIYFPYPEEYEGSAYQFSRNELNKRMKLSPGKEVILEARSYQMENGLRPFTCESLITEPEILETADHMIVIRAVFSDDTLEVTNHEAASDPVEVLTLNDVIALSRKGCDLTWSDFEEFEYIETGSGLYIRRYEINEMFHFAIGGAGPVSEPMYMYLGVNWDDPEDRIDIREGGVAEYIQAHNEEYGNPKDAPDFTGNLNQGLNAEVIGLDYDQKILYVRDIDESAAVFGTGCAIDCTYAISQSDLIYANYADPNDVRAINFSDFELGDALIISMYDSEKEKAYNGSAVAEQVQLATRRLLSETRLYQNGFDDEALLNKIVRQLELPTDCTLSYLAGCAVGSDALMWFTVEGSYPDRYVAVRCEQTGSGKYRFEEILPTMTYAADIVHVLMDSHDIFLINDRQVKSIVYRDEAGDIVKRYVLNEQDYPYIFLLSPPVSAVTCTFCDSNGEEIR